MITDWSIYQIPYNGVTYQMHYRDAVNLVACEDYIPNSPSPDYPAPITSIGEVSGIDLTVTGNAGQSYQVHQNIILRSLPDGTHDTWDVVTGTVIRNIGVKVFDGTESWTLWESYGFYTSVLSAFLSRSSNAGLCTHFACDGLRANPSNEGRYCYNLSGGVGNGNVTFKPTGFSGMSLANWTAFLAAQHAAGTPVTVYYKLATPTTEQIDPAPLPTYPRYTMLNCNAEVTARVRVIEHGL